MRGRKRAGRRVLVLGFEPFGGHSVNASELAVRALEGQQIAGRRIVTGVLPVRFDAALGALERSLRAVRPELVICVGQAEGRAEIAVERVAINVIDARIRDNAGVRPIDRAIVAHGPAAYWSTLPIKAVVAALARRRIPAVISQTAGTFVCNQVFYGLMRNLARRRGIRGGFIHVPLLPIQTKRRASSLPLARIVAALHIAITTSLESRATAV